MKVTLAHAPNPDIQKGRGYWQPTVDGPCEVEVASLAEASRACRAYIERNGQGGGNWVGGKVTDDAGRHVADISYNGRAWQPVADGRPTLHRVEIPLPGIKTVAECEHDGWR